MIFSKTVMTKLNSPQIPKTKSVSLIWEMLKTPNNIFGIKNGSNIHNSNVSNKTCEGTHCKFYVFSLWNLWDTAVVVRCIKCLFICCGERLSHLQCQLYTIQNMTNFINTAIVYIMATVSQIFWSVIKVCAPAIVVLWCPDSGSLSLVKINSSPPPPIPHPRPQDKMAAIFLNALPWIPIGISLKFVPKSWIDNKLALIQVMARRRTGAKPLPNQCWPDTLTHICGTRGRWVNW